jgi:hypothetical protein
VTEAAPIMQDHDTSGLPEGVACYVYGIVPAARRDVPGDVTGLDDTPVELVVHGEVAAVVGGVTIDRPPGRRAELVAHSRVLDAVAAASAVIPVRFGSFMPSVAAVVEELLGPNHDRFTALLADLAGRAQFSIRARYNEAAVLAEVVAEQPEVAHLREITRGLPEEAAYPQRVRLGELVSKTLEAKREADTAIMLDAILPHTVAYHVRAGSDLDHMADVASLADVDQRQAFEDAAEAVAEAMHERARLRLLGPMAPYDFVAEE